jgi:THO complex subunit 1
VSFRRYVLIQALIIMDFLLSLSSKAKAKLPDPVANKSVAYIDQVLSEEDVSD